MSAAVPNPLNILEGVATATMTSPYGKRTLNGITAFHYGIDVKPIANVLCPARGKVVKVVSNILASQTKDFIAKGIMSAGNQVKIQHANGISGYAHLAEGSVAVKVGDIVEKGQVIGKVGSTGYSTGPHLHFTFETNGKRVDPTPYFNGSLPIVPIKADAVVIPDLPFFKVITDGLRYRDDANGKILGTLTKGAIYPYIGLTKAIDGYVWAIIIVNNTIVYAAVKEEWNELSNQPHLNIPAQMVSIIKGKTYQIDITEIKP